MTDSTQSHEKFESRTGAGALFFGTAWAIGHALLARINTASHMITDDPERQAMLAADIRDNLENAELGLQMGTAGATFLVVSYLRDQLYPPTNEFNIPNKY